MKRILRWLLFSAGWVASTLCFADYPVGTVKWSLCHLEVRRGPYGNGQPSALPIQERNGRASANDVIRGDEGDLMCWRREGTPNDCNTPVSPNWTCHSTSMGIQEGQPSAFEIQ
jgi:hypothetical protein